MTQGILERLRARDPLAQAELREWLYPQIAFLCRRLLQDTTTAEQVATDIWTDFVVDYVDRVREERAIGQFVRMLTVRRCVRLTEAQAKHVALGDPLGNDESPEAQVIASVDGPRWRTRLRECMRHVRPRTRSALRLRYHRDMTLEAVGRSLGVSKQAVQQLLTAALSQLRACLEAQG